MLAAAMLLKSKRVPSRLDLLVSPPSRQVLEVLAQSGALVDLVATGARVIEPDHRVVTSEIYPPTKGSISLRTSDPEPRIEGAPRFVVASAETVAYAVATGTVGDPRSFKRPVRVTVPRALPTDDVLVLREKKGESQNGKKAPALPPLVPIKDALTLELHESAFVPAEKKGSGDGLALLLSTLDEVRSVAERPLGRAGVRALVASFVPSYVVSTLAAEGIACFSTDASTVKAMKGQKTLVLPAPAKWSEGVSATAGKTKAQLTWLAKGAEQAWTTGGGLRSVPSGKSK
jgi:aconitate hydratase